MNEHLASLRAANSTTLLWVYLDSLLSASSHITVTFIAAATVVTAAITVAVTAVVVAVVCGIAYFWQEDAMRQ